MQAEEHLQILSLTELQFLLCHTAVNISAHICIKQERIDNLIRIYSITAHRYIYIKTDISVNYPEWDWICCSEFIIYQFFCIKIINPLVFACIAAKCKTLLYCIKSPVDPLSQTSGKNTWFCGCIIGKLSGFCKTSTTFPCSTMIIH